MCESAYVTHSICFISVWVIIFISLGRHQDWVMVVVIGTYEKNISQCIYLEHCLLDALLIPLRHQIGRWWVLYAATLYGQLYAIHNYVHTHTHTQLGDN